MRKILVFLLVSHAVSLSSSQNIVISKQEMYLYVISTGNSADTLFIAPIGLGVNMGNKQQVGDQRTPEGTFHIQSIERASHWTHDFNDGKGPRKGAYGDWFVRLKVPKFKGIGIHGTCFPESIGTRCSEGCIRLRNEDLRNFVNYIEPGMMVTITEDTQSQ